MPMRVARCTLKFLVITCRWWGPGSESWLTKKKKEKERKKFLQTITHLHRNVEIWDFLLLAVFQKVLFKNVSSVCVYKGSSPKSICYPNAHKCMFTSVLQIASNIAPGSTWGTSSRNFSDVTGQENYFNMDLGKPWQAIFQSNIKQHKAKPEA